MHVILSEPLHQDGSSTEAWRRPKDL